LAWGRRRRRPSSAIRRAARERDHGRCRFPGCESRRVDLHHIQHWVNGGRTDLDNLISLCPWHHKVVHDRGYTIAAPPAAGGTFAFFCPDGTPLPSCPPLPGPQGSISETHDADITPDTIIPPWYGERLDLNHAIWTCFANARTDEQKQADWEQAQEPAFRPDTRGGDFSDTADYIRRYYDEHPAA
jgi:HNH endonuclease